MTTDERCRAEIRGLLARTDGRQIAGIAEAVGMIAA